MALAAEEVLWKSIKTILKTAFPRFGLEQGSPNSGPRRHFTRP